MKSFDVGGRAFLYVVAGCDNEKRNKSEKGFFHLISYGKTQKSYFMDEIINLDFSATHVIPSHSTLFSVTNGINIEIPEF